MKRTITLVLLFIFSMIVTGQNTRNKIIRFDKLKKHSTIKINDFDKIRPPLKIKKSLLLNLKSNQSYKKQLDSLIVYEWRPNNNLWQKNNKEEYAFGVDVNTDMAVYFDWNLTTNQWDYFYMDKYTYDTNGYLVLVIYSYSNLGNNQWDYDYKDEYTYDANGNMIGAIYYDYNTTNNQWIKDWKDEFSYDTNSNVIVGKDFYWDSYTNKWIADSKYDYTYDTNGNMIRCISSYWLNYDEDWAKEWMETYTSDTNRNRISTLFSEWNTTIEEWDSYYKAEYVYDANGNPVTEFYSYFNDNSNQWVYEEKYEYTYDQNFNINEIILPPLYVLYPDNYENIINMPISFKSYNFNNGNWIDSNEGTYYNSDSDTPLAINDEIFSSAINCYPNPVSHVLAVESETFPITRVEIYSILGKKVKEISSNFNSIKMNNLSNGIYLVRIFSEKGFTSRKLIKK